MVASFVVRNIQALTKRPNILYEMSIPERWLDYSRSGNKFKDLPFICFKTPLKESYNQYMSREDSFTPSELCEEMNENGHKLGMVIDLTNTRRYYDGTIEFKRRRGIEYEKLLFDPYRPESFSEVYKKFATIITEFLRSALPDTIIGIHCTHGLNRTGYMICRYMIEEHNYTVEEAVNAFNEARGHAMEKYLDRLRTDYERREAARNGISLPGEETKSLAVAKDELEDWRSRGQDSNDQRGQDSNFQNGHCYQRRHFGGHDEHVDLVDRKNEYEESRNHHIHYHTQYQYQREEGQKRDGRVKGEELMDKVSARDFPSRDARFHPQQSRRIFHADKYYPPWEQNSEVYQDVPSWGYHDRSYSRNWRNNSWRHRSKHQQEGRKDSKSDDDYCYNKKSPSRRWKQLSRQSRYRLPYE